MDYETFEGRFDRRDEGRRLRAQVEKKLAAGTELHVGVVPDAATVAQLTDKWLPEGFHRCLGGDELLCGGPRRCGERCTAAYWRGHMSHVGEMMRRMAVALDEDPVLWQATGALHDVDYLRAPHHEEGVASGTAHPVGISRWLFEHGAPPLMVLAILEHSPHLGMPPGSALARALVACDEHATMTANNQSPEYPDDIPTALQACLFTRPRGTIRGFVRDDMWQRAVAALRGLPRAP